MAKFYTLLDDDMPHKAAGYDITSCFQSAFIEVRRTAENAVIENVIDILRARNLTTPLTLHLI